MTREEYIDAHLTLQLLGALAEEHGGLTGYSNETSTSNALRLTLRFADGTAYRYAEDGGAVTLTEITETETE